MACSGAFIKRNKDGTQRFVQNVGVIALTELHTVDLADGMQSYPLLSFVNPDLPHAAAFNHFSQVFQTGWAAFNRVPLGLATPRISPGRASLDLGVSALSAPLGTRISCSRTCWCLARKNPQPVRETGVGRRNATIGPPSEAGRTCKAVA